jgi:Ribbon-helix-helix protein, copG family
VGRRGLDGAVRLTVRLAAPLAKSLAARAKREGVSQAELCRRLVEEGLSPRAAASAPGDVSQWYEQMREQIRGALSGKVDGATVASLTRLMESMEAQEARQRQAEQKQHEEITELWDLLRDAAARNGGKPDDRLKGTLQKEMARSQAQLGGLLDLMDEWRMSPFPVADEAACEALEWHIALMEARAL